MLLTENQFKKLGEALVDTFDEGLFTKFLRYQVGGRRLDTLVGSGPNVDFDEKVRLVVGRAERRDGCVTF